MKVDVICTEHSHPVWPWLQQWAATQRDAHDVSIVSSSADLRGGDVLFLVSCHEFIGSAIRSQYRATLVLHASDLPEGRGWSPHVWQILAGQNEFTVSIIEADDDLDTGAIVAQARFALEGHELYNEINDKLFATEIGLMTQVMDAGADLPRHEQPDRPASYHRKRRPADSRLDLDRPLGEQFDLLRVSDPVRYPAFFDLRGHRYVVRITKGEGEGES